MSHSSEVIGPRRFPGTIAEAVRTPRARATIRHYPGPSNSLYRANCRPVITEEDLFLYKLLLQHRDENIGVL